MDLDGGPTAGTPAPYGQACINCARAKCRCTFRGSELGSRSNSSCDRCHRLKKDCQPSVSSRRKGTKRKTRTAQLEEKLEDLVTLLKHQTQRDAAKIPLAGVPSPQPLQQLTPEEPCYYQPELARLAPPQTSSPMARLAAKATDELDPYEANGCVELFRNVYLPFFPLITLPISTGWKELKANRPLLWLCIVAVTSRSTAQSQALSLRAKEIISKRLFVDGERDLEMLLGVIILVTWSIYPTKGKAYMWLLVHAAIALTDDLGLERPRENLECRASFANLTPNLLASAGRDLNRTVEESRAFLACYLSCSTISHFFHRPNPMRWTISLQRALAHLHEAADQKGDAIIVAQVHVQRLLDQISLTPWITREPVDESDMSLNPHFHIRMLLARLKDIRETYMSDPEVAQHHGLQLCARGTEVAIRELITMIPATRQLTERDHTERLEVLNACLHSIKLWFDEFRELPLDLYLGIPFRLFSDFPICFQVLCRLVVLDSVPGWDRAAARETADPLALLDDVADRMARIPVLMGLTAEGTEGDRFTRSVVTVRKRRQLVVSALEQAGVLTPGLPPPPSSSSGSSGAATEMEGLDLNVGGVGEELQGLMGFIDETWLAEMFGGWERSPNQCTL